MPINIEAIIYYIFLADSLMANFVAYFKPKWYKKTYKSFSKIFPISKGWCALYLFLVLWIGYALYRLGVLPY